MFQSRICCALAAALLLATASASASQDKKAQAGLPTPVPEPLLKKAGLSADQQAKLKTAAEAFRAEVQRLKEQGVTPDQKQAFGAAGQAYMAVVDSTLTAAQREQIQALAQEARSFQPLGELGFTLVALDLTDDQKARIRETVARYRADLENLGAAAKLNNDATAAQKVNEMRRQLIAEVTALLTPEQRQQLPPAKK